MYNPTPSYNGANLVNLAAELEIRLTGRSPTRGLRPKLARLIPHTRNYLLLIIDGLGDHQLTHPAAATLRQHRRAALTAPFPTTTSVGLSSVATALAPMQHGVIGYTQWIPTLRTVVNMLEWTDMATGQPIDLDPAAFHPTPNLPERLGAAGVRTTIFQPTELMDTPVSNMLCRGAERHGYTSLLDIQPSVLFDAGNRTLAVVYTTAVDTAAHASGQRSQAYSTALSQTGQAWEHFRRSLPPDTTLIGSADHGHCDIPRDGRIHLDENLTDGMTWWGRRPHPPVPRTPRTGTPHRPADGRPVRQRRPTTPMVRRRTPTPGPQRVPDGSAPSPTGNDHPPARLPQPQHRPPRRDHLPRATSSSISRLDNTVPRSVVAGVRSVMLGLRPHFSPRPA